MKERTIPCPCCKAQKKEKEYQQILSLFPFQGAMRDINSERYYIDNNSYQWACDKCLKSGKAILGNPKKQYFTFFNPADTATPYLAYYDQNRRCKQCDAKFNFNKEEQQHWYEKLQFIVYSKPNHCPNCRKDIRTTKALNEELSELLRNGEPNSIPALERVSTIYSLMGNEEKTTAYRRKAEKLHRKSNK